MRRIYILLVTTFCIFANQAWAHEYYLMPESFTPKSGVELGVRHRLGQKFKGNELPFINSWNIRSEVWQDGEMKEIRRKDGDRPALIFVPQKSGLLTFVHQSNVDFITFQTYEKFQNYTRKEGIDYVLEASENGTKPKIKLTEGYSRFAKTLVAVDGSQDGADTPVGLKIELIALDNPYALAANQPLPVQVLYEGKPLEDVRITVFVGVDTEFKYQFQTDKDGKASIPADGPGPYLLNAIRMTEPQSEIAKSKQAHWESFWASLTFERKH